MAGKYEFDAEIKKHPGLNAGFIEFPYDAKKEFGKNRFPSHIRKNMWDG